MKRFLIVFLLTAVALSHAEELKVWKYQSPRDLMADRIYAYAAKGSLVEKSLSSEKTPDGASVLKISLKQIVRFS